MSRTGSGASTVTSGGTAAEPPSRPQVWALSFVPAADFPDLAVAYESYGWDGLLAADSQNLTGDPFAAISVAATRTSRLRLGTGVSNPVTRHPAQLASAATTAQVFSGGRMVLGIGRGDSSLSHIGRRPAPVAEFERVLGHLRDYFDNGYTRLGEFTSRMEWITRTGLPPVPIEVAASGPRVIDVGARFADRLAFTVGVQPEAVAEALATARRARSEAGLDPEGISYGAYLNVATHPDLEVARELISGSLSVLARFADRSSSREPHRDYRIDSHANTRPGASFDGQLRERFAIVGDPDHCVARIQPLIDLGLDFVIIAGHSRDADRGHLFASAAHLGAEVIPALQPA